MSLRFVLPLLALASCTREIGLADLGACADSSQGGTYGEIGIGTCLAGPVDVHAFEQGGDTWLAVVNADPFRNFASGSLLLIDWSSVDLDARVNYLHELDATALPMDPYVGGAGVLVDRDLVLVSGRLSEGAPERSHPDALHVVDISDPTAPTLWAEGDELTLEDDPQPIAVDPDADRAYVLNITDHSVSVIDTSTTPISEVQVGIFAQVGDAAFNDADGSGSSASVHGAYVDDETKVITDTWTLSWVEGTQRLWVPTDGGLARWSWGGIDAVPSGMGVELDPDDSAAITEIRDPFLGEIDDVPVLYFADDDAIRLVTPDNATIAEWDLADADHPVLLGGDDWDVRLGSPVVVDLTEALAIYYDGRTEPGAPASIGMALSDDGLTWRRGDPVVTAPSWATSVEQPFVRYDEQTLTWRMWMSVYDGAQWSVGYAESEDGEAWSEVTEVLQVPGAHVAAPVVTWAHGRYQAWVATGNGATWSISTTWSVDGLDWSTPEPVLDTDAAADSPPRVALQHDPAGVWRVEGLDSGLQSAQASAGTSTSVTDYGFTFRVSSGCEIDLLGEMEDLIPGSLAGDTLYATAVDPDGRPRLVALRQAGDSWALAGDDLVPEGTGGNVGGATDPVVVADGAGWSMYYGAQGEDGLTRVYRATSSDGLAWTASADPVIPTDGVWDAQEQRPSAAEALDGGGLRLWYSGWDGSRWRVGAAESADGVTFNASPGASEAWVLGPGQPGTFDDTGVRDAVVYEEDGARVMLYAGTPDGLTWELGSAVELEDGTWERRTDPATGAVVALHGGVAGTCSDQGVRAPVLTENGVLMAAYDGVNTRVSRAVGGASALFPDYRLPTPGDTLEFTTTRGEDDLEVISLDTVVEGHNVWGIGASALRLDPERGFLYVVSKRSNLVFVLDVRDDSGPGFDDRNYLDVEAVLAVAHTSDYFGFRDVLPRPGTDLLYATARYPDTVEVIDLSNVVDDDQAQYLRSQTLGDLPLPTLTDGGGYQTGDAGVESVARIAGAGMALTPDERTLLVTHFRGNGLAAFDLELGAWGEEVAWIPDLGENPHDVTLTPDGRYAIVANYLGQVEDDLVSSTLAVVDIDPDSPTYLEVVTWLVNR